MKHDKQSQTSQEASTHQHGTDALSRLMTRFKVPVTRESYLNLAYLGHPPKELGAEEEADLPKAAR